MDRHLVLARLSLDFPRGRTDRRLACSCGGAGLPTDATDRVGRTTSIGTFREVPLFFRPQIRRDYPLNLSISVSGGKETNKDSLSNGE